MARRLALVVLVAAVLGAGAARADDVGVTTQDGDVVPAGVLPPLSFFPQAGVLWQDLTIGNFVDLDPGPGARDFECGTRVYDGHGGEDSLIRSFREQAIGVPVFAALDGTVAEIQNYYPDDSTAETAGRQGGTRFFDNHVVLDHGNGFETVYGHLKRGSISVRLGHRVVAGEQIGSTGSSGNSAWPHLHFTLRYRGSPLETFAGACRPGPSFWAEQAPVRREAYARDVVFSAQPFTGRRDLPWDEARRTGTFRVGTRDLYVRLVLANPGAGPARVRILRPDGSVALEDPSAPVDGSPVGVKLHYRLALDRPGPWQLVYDLDGRTLVAAPFDAVAAGAAVANRPPARVTAQLVPGEVVQCRVSTQLAFRDPDYDLVRYRYRWTVGGRVVRDVTSAALSDAIPKGTARPGARVACTVTPSDGKLAARPAAVTLP